MKEEEGEKKNYIYIYINIHAYIKPKISDYLMKHILLMDIVKFVYNK